MKFRILFLVLLAGVFALATENSANAQSAKEKRKTLLWDLANRVAERVTPELKKMGFHSTQKEFYRKNSNGISYYTMRYKHTGHVVTHKITGIKWEGKTGSRRAVPTGEVIETKSGPATLNISIDWGDLYPFKINGKAVQVSEPRFRHIGPSPKGGQTVLNTPYKITRTQKITKKTYHGFEGEMMSVRIKGQTTKSVTFARSSFDGKPSPYYELINIDRPTRVRATANFKIDDASQPLRIFVAGTNGISLEAIDEGMVDQLMRLIARATRLELGDSVGSNPPPQVVKVDPPKDSTPTPGVTPTPLPQPRPEPNKPQGLTEEDLKNLAAIAAMDRILESLEQPLQEGLAQLVFLTRSNESLRRQMRELSKLRREVNDDSLKKKIQERISRNVQDLRDTAAELRKLTSSLETRMSDATAALKKIFGEHDFDSLQVPAFTRVELGTTRATLLEAQIALATNQTERAKDLALAMRSNFRLNGTGHYIDGMALLQEGKLLDAAAVFRLARQNQRVPAGPAWESLERSTEIQILRALQRTAGDTARAFDKEFEQWISAKAESNRPYDQTRWEWFKQRFLKRSIYDTVSGLTPAGVGEANLRADEAGTVFDQMATTHIGLNFIIALRENNTLEEISKFTAEGFDAATQKRWGQKLPEEQLKRMRQLIHHAFQNPDMKKLATGKAHLDPNAFSGRLAKQIELSGVYFKGGKVASVGAGMVDGWTLLTSLAPMSKITFAGTALPMGGKTAAKFYKNTQNLHEWFAASRVATAAVDKLNKTRAGKLALEAMGQAHTFSEQGIPQFLAATAAQTVVDGGAAFAAERYLGQEAGMIVDVFTTLGVTTPEIYSKTMANLSREQAQRTALQLVERAEQQTRVVEGVWKLVDEVPVKPGEELDFSKIRVLQERVRDANLPDVLADRVHGLVAAVESGEAALVQQFHRDLGRSIKSRRKLITQARTAARHLEGAAPKLLPEYTGPRTIDSPHDLIQDTGRTLVNADGRSPRADGAGQRLVGDPLDLGNNVPTDPRGTRPPIGDPLAPESGVPSVAGGTGERPPIGDPLAQAEVPADPRATLPAKPDGRPDISDVGTPVRIPAVAGKPGPLHGGRNLAISNLADPLSEGDRLFATGRFGQV